MSYSSHVRRVMNPELPLATRVSHLRSCAMLVARKYGVPRSEILTRIGIEPTYPAGDLPSPVQIEHALAILQEVRRRGVGAA